MKKILVIGLVLVAAYFGGTESGLIAPQRVDVAGGIDHVDGRVDNRVDDGDALAEAFEQRRSDVQVRASGEVVRVLADDNDGSRHQRFIVRMASGQTILLAHNIDLAGRVAALKAGDTVEFNGEYEWNPQGGVVHWTHRDPRGAHEAGWIKHHGRTYQ